MNTVSTSQISRDFVEAFSTISSTEDLIIFVAGKDNMLPFCQELLEQYDRDELSFMPMEINTLCADKGVIPGLLYAEVRKVLLALNKFHDESQDHYEILGLKEGASPAEIKKAYRDLSKQLHPDAAGADENTTQQFMEVSGAYHALMTSLTEHDAAPARPWRKEKPGNIPGPRRDRKNFLAIVLLLIIVLAGVSIFLSRQYHETASLSQAESWAVITPAAAPAVAEAVPSVPPEEAAAPHAELPPPVPTAQEQVPAEEIQPEEETAAAQTVSEEDIAAEEIVSAEELAVEEAPEEKAIDQENPTPPENEPSEIANAQPTVNLEQERSNPDQQVELIAAAEPVSSNTALENQPRKKTPPVAPATITEPAAPHQQEQNKTIAAATEPAAPQAEEPEKLHPAIAISNLLDRYTDSYNHRKLDAFLDLFTENATENGKLQSLLIDQYTTLFNQTLTIRLNLDNVQWKEHQEGFQVTCSFKSLYSYTDGKIKKHSGNIIFYLVDTPKGLKIQSLEYTFWS